MKYRRDFVHLSRLESNLVIVMLAVRLLDRKSGDVELFIALICTLIVEIRRKREGLCGTRYVPFPKRIRFMVVNTVDDAEAVFPQFNFHKHFLFRGKTTFMRFAFALGLCNSLDAIDEWLPLTHWTLVKQLGKLLVC